MTEFNCIAIETSTQQGSVAASFNGRQVVHTLEEGQSSSRQIYQLIREMLGELEAAVNQFDCIAFGCGPGSFTGVRVATSAAQALAYASELPVCRVSSLAALAVPELNDKPVAVCLDARMGEAYIGIYRQVDGGVICELDDQLADPQLFRLVDVESQAVAVGAGWKEWACMLEGFDGDVINDCYPHAQNILVLAEKMYANNEIVLPQDALPNYVRNTVTQ